MLKSQFSGSFEDFLRRQIFDSLDYVLKTKEKSNENQIGPHRDRRHCNGRGGEYYRDTVAHRLHSVKENLLTNQEFFFITYVFFKGE